jgi:hypothetical protein
MATEAVGLAATQEADMHLSSLRHRFPIVVAAAWLGACGGGSDDEDATTDGDAAPDADDATTTDDVAADDATPDVTDTGEETDAACPDCGMIRIYVEGDTTPKTFTDSLDGQTPFEYLIGVSSYRVLRSADDIAPVTCFDYGADTFAIDMQTDNLVGRCATSSFPLGTYTHGMTKVDWITYKVVGDVHVGTLALPATFQIFKAFSACDYDGTHYAAGTGWVGYDVSGTTGRIPYVFPELAAIAGVIYRTEGDAFYMIFPFTHPFVIGEADALEHWSRMFWEIADSYRWLDLRLDGYASGRWDVSSTGTTEEVRMFGVSGYHIESSAD